MQPDIREIVPDDHRKHSKVPLPQKFVQQPLAVLCWAAGEGFCCRETSKAGAVRQNEAMMMERLRTFLVPTFGVARIEVLRLMALAEIQKRGSAMRSLRYGIVGVWTYGCSCLRHARAKPVGLRVSQPRELGFLVVVRHVQPRGFWISQLLPSACARVAVSVAGVRQT